MAEKALITVTSTGQSFPVMYNPVDYTHSSESRVSGEGSNVQFQRVDPEDLTVNLLFDAYEEQGAARDVRKKTTPILELIMPTVEKGQAKQPPVTVFAWGKFSFTGIVVKTEQKFIMFLDSGVPVRSEVTITFKAVLTPEQQGRYTGNEACLKMYTVRGSDRLDLIAARFTGNSANWKILASENKIYDPLVFPRGYVGKRILIPDL